MTLAPGTRAADGMSARTLEQSATLQGMITANGQVGSQYSGSIILPDGTVTRDVTIINKPPARVAEIDRNLSAAGKPSTVFDEKGVAHVVTSGGYLFFLNTDAIPVEYYPVSSTEVQTVAEKALTALAPSEQSASVTHRIAVELAMKGLQTDGTPVDASYLDLMAKWAAAEGIPFTRPSAAVSAALATPAPAVVTAKVLGSGQGIAAVSVMQVLPNYTTPTPPPAMDTPVFTQGAIIPEDFTPAQLRSPTYVPQQETAIPAMLAADTTTAPATSPEQDATVAAAATRTKYIVGGVVLAVLAVVIASGKGK